MYMYSLRKLYTGMEAISQEMHNMLGKYTEESN